MPANGRLRTSSGSWAKKGGGQAVASHVARSPETCGDKPVGSARGPQTFTVRLAATQQAIDFARRESHHHRMEDVEVPRYNAALKAFSDAFNKGYTEGKQLRAVGEPLLDIESVFTVEVPSDDVLDNRWHSYCDTFKDAGRRAALARRRTAEAALSTSPERDLMTDNFRWFVHLTGVPLTRDDIAPYFFSGSGER
jgi:hypothetical protein